MPDNILRTLLPTGRVLLTKAFLQGQEAWLPDDRTEAHIEDIDASYGLDALDEALDTLLEETPAYTTAIDVALAEILHTQLPLTRRLASDAGVWRYLAVVHRPDVVRHRWNFASEATTKPRYWHVGLRPNSNMFARLWWIAEMTSEDEEYTMTRRALTRSSFANTLFARGWAQYAPIARVCINALVQEESDIFQAVLQELTTVFATIPVEALSADDLTKIVLQVRRVQHQRRDDSAR